MYSNIQNSDRKEFTMKYAINPRTGEPITKNLVLIYGFNEEDTKKIVEKIPDNYEPCICTSATDLYAIPSVYHFVNPISIPNEELAELLSIHQEIKELP